MQSESPIEIRHSPAQTLRSINNYNQSKSSYSPCIFYTKIFQTYSNVFVQLSNNNCKIISLACSIGLNIKPLHIFPKTILAAKFFSGLIRFCFFSCGIFSGQAERGAPLSGAPLKNNDFSRRVLILRNNQLTFRISTTATCSVSDVAKINR